MSPQGSSPSVEDQRPTESEQMAALSKRIGVPYVPLRGRSSAPEVLRAVPTRVAHFYGLFPLEWRDGALVVAMSHPEDAVTVDDIRQVLQTDVVAVLAGQEEIRDAFMRHYGVGAETLDELSPEASSGAAASRDAEDLKASSEDASVVKFVNQLLLEALEKRATDIHLEPYERELRVRRRVDGVLADVSVPATIQRFQAAIVSRIKVMADLDIAERRLPQDGRIQRKVAGNDVDMRVSILPTPFGESVTIRLLTSKLFLDLEQLGFFPQDMAYLESLLEKPHGIILLTGPTGSGKTTTLYSFLSKINREDAKIITIEDPIEYQLRGITQIQVQSKIGLDFARGLRSMLRHDPDVMMVGEIRDLETAEIAIRVALTGHLVFSTLHTNDAPGAVTRLIDMGLEPFLVSSSLECVIAQRLVRTICRHCKEEYRYEGSPADGFQKDRSVFRGRGCERCGFTGYYGRTTIYELLSIHRDIRDQIMQRSSSDQIRRLALGRGMKTLRQCGWEKIHAGLTTPEEVLRVTMKEEDA
ncbi:MAG: type II/IV secretion system protein [Elusimicrobia bacterium]|nr:type II/IV secretion system protein [Elusimicrobiota bacterium]